MKSPALIALVLAVCVLAVAASGATTKPPSLRVGAAPGLALVGAGFKPRVVVTLKITSPQGTRRATVRAGALGGFTIRFPGIDRCQPNVVTALAANGASARIPVVWFIRECIPPPPLEPGIPSPPGIAGG